MLERWIEKLADYFAEHEEQAFLLKMGLLLGAILLLRSFIRNIVPFLLFGFLFAPVYLLLFAYYRASTTGRSTFRVILDNLAIVPVVYAEGEWRKEGFSWFTYLLIFVNVVVFYGFQPHAGKFVEDSLLFLPHAPTLLNVPLSLFSSLFLHGSQGHLWGNMMFLWAVGAVLERRIGALRFALIYLASGVAGNLLGAWVMYAFQDKTLHCLGASGAISGLMGLFAVRCYFKTLVFPLPLLGLISLLFPLNLKVRVNALAVISLFFLLDLTHGIDQVAGVYLSRTAHWVHVGGMLAGIAAGFWFKLQREGVGERHLERGVRVNPREIISHDSRQKSLRKALEVEPENLTALLHLARAKSRYEKSPEGRELYAKALGLLLRKDVKQACEVFVEYLNRYGMPLKPSLHYHLASLLVRQGNWAQATRSFRLLYETPQVEAEWAEKALYGEGRVLHDQGQLEAAENTYRLFLQRFPASELSVKVKSALASF